ncbi:hypothetical protein AXG93_2168s1010 [Marchantia polymorpha subsp. ruderalis]|uniref:F-box domain-containing protein n=1 Tax=Marchantia polymorpha subsp. ruderalis TaxID=1480154 RepID=A0A176WGG0_MARPO|nr:hypothetical protein AXG93_2168s1010 [Marchantia polymorpha subsp. ruderalis]
MELVEREEDRPHDLLDSLPVELLIKVLRDQDLPVFTLAECRSVCRKWKDIIDGPQLRNKIWKEPVILYDACIDNTAYFCFHDRWIRRNITFRPKHVVAADGGLLCFNELFSTEYVMYNPVEDKFLTLNVPHEIDGVSAVLDDMLERIMVGLVVDQSTKHFKLVLGGVLVPDRRRSLIYDSTTTTWSWIIHPFPTLVNWMEVEWHSGRCVICKGCLYSLVWDPTVMIKALLIFDLREETWNVLAEEVMEDKPGRVKRQAKCADTKAGSALLANVGAADCPRYRAMNMEVIELDTDFGHAFSGVLDDEVGRVQALWGSVSSQVKYGDSSPEDHQFVSGLPVYPV